LKSTEPATTPRISGRHAPGSVAALAIAIGVVIAVAPSLAGAEDKKACANAYVQAQVQRQKGHLKASRGLLLVCASECSADLRTDCASWLREVEAALPSIVVEAVGPDGKETADVRVTCDGVELYAKLDGRAIPMDPGPHTCRAEMLGEPAKEEQLLVPEGEQHRPWRVSFKHPAASRRPATKPPDTGASPAPSPSTPGQSTPLDIPLSVLVVGGLGAIATTVGIALEVSGLSQHSALDRCKGSCAPSAVNSDRTTFQVGDVTLGIGLASLAAAAVLFFTRPSAAASTTARGAWLLIDPHPGGADVGLGGRF
jgi:hypothetical protein